MSSNLKIRLLCFLAALCWLAIPVAAGESPASFQIPVGSVVELPELGLHFESFTLPTEGLSALGSGRFEGVEFSAFPVAPGKRQGIRFEPYRLYAPGAKIWAIVDGERREIPKDPGLYFLGASPDGKLRAGLSLRGDELEGLVVGPTGMYLLRGPDAHGAYAVEAAAPSPASRLENCGTEHLPIPDSVFAAMDSAEATAGLGLGAERAGGGSASRQAVIAVDTDTELLDEKFSDSTAAATAWIADLFVALNTMYERDLDLTLLQGETILRVGTDPYNNTDTPASQAQLIEFGNVWFATQSDVERVFAMLLSGKSSSPNSASGIAWIDGYCENQSVGGGYSVNQIFTGNFPASQDARLVGHELGHNAGSPHTHCYTPPVDECYRAESGCYSGSVSCPAGGSGTVMSYCNFGPPNGAGCGPNDLIFHPTVQNVIGGLIDNHTPGCIVAIGQLFSDGFESGNTSRWSDTVP